jgi:hypothetical protein
MKEIVWKSPTSFIVRGDEANRFITYKLLLHIEQEHFFGYSEYVKFTSFVAPRFVEGTDEYNVRMEEYHRINEDRMKRRLERRLESKMK